METTDRLDRLIPWAMVLTILAVAVFAFVQSYTHVYYLGQTHHETGASLRMLPLSVDWLMFAAGLTRLHLLRKGIRHKLPLSALALGAIATLIANIAAGIIWGWQTAAINAWAPVVLFVTVELGMLLVRTAKAKLEPAKQEEAKPSRLELAAEIGRVKGQRIQMQADQRTELRQSQPAPEPSPETATMPKVVSSPEPALEGWGQLAGQEPAGQPESLERRPGLSGNGLRPRGQ